MTDAVITWVDSTDVAWQKRLEQYRPRQKDDNSDDARFRDWGTLLYVLRGIEQCAPWIRTVHLITEGHVPRWLRLNHPKLRCVKHDDLFADAEALPTFNSNAIELSILRIPDLAEQFILFNDDTILLKPVTEDYFFKNGIPVDFLVQNPFKHLVLRTLYRHHPWVVSAHHVLTVMNQKMHKHGRDKANMYTYDALGTMSNKIANLLSHEYLFLEHFHQPQPHLKKTWEIVSRMFNPEINATIHNKLRTSKDISHYIFRYYNLMTGTFYPIRHRDHATYTVSSVRVARACASSLHKLTLVCINDDKKLKATAYTTCQSIIQQALEQVLPTKSSFEK